MTSVGRRRRKGCWEAEEGSSEDPSKERERKEGRQIKDAKAKLWSSFREQQNREGRRFWWKTGGESSGGERRVFVLIFKHLIEKFNYTEVKLLVLKLQSE